MINAEKYKEQLRKANIDTVMFENWGFDNITKTFRQCGCMFCKKCVMNDIEKNERKNYVGCNHARMTWLLSEYVEPILLNELEYNIIKFIKDNTKISYIARDKDGTLFLYDSEPHKSKANDWWLGKGSTPFTPFNKMFSFIKWEDEEPYSISDILKNCRVISDNIVIHKIVDE